MPRDLALVQSDKVPLEGSLTIVGGLIYVGPHNVLVEVCSKPVRRTWFPKACVRSPVGFHVADVTLEVPLQLALEKGLISRHNLPPQRPLTKSRGELPA